MFAPSLLEWHRGEKPAQGEESVVELPPEFCRILIPAGSHGVNTLLPVLQPNPILVSGHWQHKKGGHQGLGPHSRHVFAASSSLTRCYLTKDGASCRGGEGQTGHDWTEPRMAKPFPGWNVCEIPTKGKHIPVSTSKQAPQGGLDPLTTLPGSPKTSSEAGEWLEKPQSASWAGKNDRGKESGQGSSRDAVIGTQTGRMI